MEYVTVTRRIDADPNSIRDAIQNVERFMLASGFDEVTVRGDRVVLRNRVGLAEIELVVQIVKEEDAVLSYEQREGMFREMRTSYRLDLRDGHVQVIATTGFELDVALVGGALDRTVVKRQRRRELEAQLESLTRLED